MSGLLRNLQVRSLTVGQWAVLWEHDPLFDPFAYTIQVLRSESPAGPFEQVSGEFENTTLWLDASAPALNQVAKIYYVVRLREKATDQLIEFGPVEPGEAPDLVAREIRSHITHLMQEFAGVRSWVFPIRMTGMRCPTCWSKKLGKRTLSGCLQCYDTGFARGYMTPIETWIQVDPANKRPQHGAVGTVVATNTTARLADWPPLKPMDVIVDGTNARWRVVKVTQTEHGRNTVHQELELHEIDHSDIVYSLPVVEGMEQLRGLQVTSPRNRTNPYDLETTEPDLTDLFTLYPGLQRI